MKLATYIVFISSFLFCNSIFAQKHASEECVIVLHGMGRTKHSMTKVENELTKLGYIVWNESYPSTKQEIEKSSTEHISKGLQYCRTRKATKIHFVTHSLGGILVRYYLQDNSIKELGNIVMLSPPNKGSEVADLLKDSKFYEWVTGPAGQQLGTNEESLPNSLKEIDAHVGIITGVKSSDPWFSPFIPGKDDGKVAVERAKLNEMVDFLVVESGHTFIMRNKSVLNQIGIFLSTGKFEK